MRKTTLLAFLLFLCSGLFCQEWQQKESMFFKEDGKFLFAVDSAISAERDVLEDKVKESLRKNLDFLQERDFDDFLAIGFVSNRGRIHQLMGKRASAFTMFKTSEMPGNSLLLIYDSLHCPLNRELMRVVLATKWGRLQDSRLTWLEQGLSTLVSPEADNCDGYTVEEKYIYLLQRGKLIDLTVFPADDISPEFKAARLQAAYIVSHLIEKYEIAKLKQLWIEGMDRFESIFGESFSDITDRINESLQSENIPPFPMDWATFTKDCIDPQPDDWLPVFNPNQIESWDKLVSKDIGNIKLIIDSSANYRDEIISKTKKYILEHLSLLNEKEFENSIHITILQNKDDMEKIGGMRVGGFFLPNGSYGYEDVSFLYAIYAEEYQTLKHELMHAVSFQKWGRLDADNLRWLSEGLATFSHPEMEGDGHTLEERYTFFLQNDKLLEKDSLIMMPDIFDKIPIKIAYSQSGYIVQYILENYGINKLKQLWQSGMDDFEEIFGITFAQMINDINTKLKEKYPDPISFNWEGFIKTNME